MTEQSRERARDVPRRYDEVDGVYEHRMSAGGITCSECGQFIPWATIHSCDLKVVNQRLRALLAARERQIAELRDALAAVGGGTADPNSEARK